MVSASFNPPVGALIVVCLNTDVVNIADFQTSVVTDSVDGTIAQVVEREVNEGSSGSGGWSAIHRGVVAGSGSRTVSASWTGVDTASKRVSAKIYVLTGQHATQNGASGEGSTTTNDVTPTLFSATGAGGIIIWNVTDWQAQGTLTSSDSTIDTDHYAGTISVASGYKTYSGTGNKTANMNGGGSSAVDFGWTAIEVIEAAGGGGSVMRPQYGVGTGGMQSMTGGMQGSAWRRPSIVVPTSFRARALPRGIARPELRV